MNTDYNYTKLLEMIDLYKSINGIDAIGLGGSSTANSSDNNSDYDIYMYYAKIPCVDDRRMIANKFSNNPEIDNHYFETGDTFKLKGSGKPIDIMYRSKEFLETNIKSVWEEHNASLGYTTCIVFNLNKTKILYDKNGWLNEMKKSVSTPYPEELARNIIEKNFNFLKDAQFSYRDQLALAIKRNDFVSVNHRCAAFLASYFDIIFAKNKLLHPGEKKLVSFALNNCKILPYEFEKDVYKIAIGDVNERLAVADKMVENLRQIL